MTDDDDLRTALTKLADGLDPDDMVFTDWVIDKLRALLAAHPAPTEPTVAEYKAAYPTGTVSDCKACHRWPGLCAKHSPAPVSDTRREDAARALIESHVAEFEVSIARLEASIQDPINTFGGREYDTAKLHGQRGAVYALRRLADVLAVLPAPPVVDEGQIQDIVREAYDTHIDLGSPARRGEFVFTTAEVIAARLRGATRA